MNELYENIVSGKIEKKDIDSWIEIYAKETRLVDVVMKQASKFAKENKEELRKAYRNKEISEKEMKDIQNKLDGAGRLLGEYLDIEIKIRGLQHG